MEIVKCIIKNKTLHPLESVKIRDFCSVHKEGTYIEMKLSEWESGRSENASRYFHKLRDRYAVGLLYEREYAKVELKYKYGDWIEYNEGFEPPEWPGEFVEIYGKIIFMKSTTAYTNKEMGILIEGTVAACIDNGIRIDDLIAEYSERLVGELARKSTAWKGK